jgi:hypothetical protein
LFAGLDHLWKQHKLIFCNKLQCCGFDSKSSADFIKKTL